MKKLALFGAAVALSGLTTGVQAADLPLAPEPVDYVRICDAYGTRFFYLPGTDTCLRVGGRIRVEYRFNNYGDGPNNWSDKAQTSTVFRSRGYIYLDSRTATEYGLLRTFTSIFHTSDSSAFGAVTPELEFSFVQFGGFTFGRTQSFWDYWTGYSWGAQVTSYSDTKSNVIAYTGTFGNGISASVSLENAASRQVQLISAGGNGYGGDKLPDAIANIRIEQGWGSAQLMGVLHHVRFADVAAEGKLGWAIGAGAQINVPFLGSKDKIAIQVAYSDGASRFPLDSWDSQITDAINIAGSTKTTKTWNIAGGWHHAFSDAWQANLEGGYHVADAATDAYDFSQWTATGNVAWTPVSGLVIGAEMQYRNVDYKAASGLADKGEIYTTFRVQRTF
ncbi:porin [Labrenzia sp. PHM005]|uniref:porin n=1 Tax=Labrenzia sp. PHM005 TaxID=2590016 RepID=UPI00113FF5CB|nr:porin [Labrenzia sp. PHM005]QDG79163.1 porin [Labrenzia sp. PHM005]